MPRFCRSAPLFAAAATLALAVPGMAQSLTSVNINTATYSVVNGTGSSNPSTFARLGNGVVFSATDAVNGRELWYSDGTAAGTRMVADIGPTWQSSTPFSTTTLGPRVLFGAWDGTNLFLHSSDGTAAGTAKVLSASGPLALSTGAPITAVNNIAFISAADGQLWRYDGTTLAPVPGTSGQQPASLTPIGTSLYYAGRVGGVARAFRLDATSPAAAPVALAPASIPLSNPSNFTLFDGLIYMQATGPSTGAEPHAYNPATDTAFLVADIVPGSNGSLPSNFTTLGTELVFLALDAASSGNLNLYAVNPSGVGVTAKTKTSPNVAIGSPAPRQIVRSGNTVYFTTGYLVAFQTQLWAYDGVSAGGWAFVVGPVSGGSFPKSLIDVSGKPYFGGIPAAGGPGNELSTVTLDASGVPLAPALAADVEPGAFRSSSPDNLILVDGRIFMSALTDAAGTELWIYQVPGAAPTARVCCRGTTCSIVLAGDCVVPAGSGVGVRVLDASATACSTASLAGCCSADFDKSGDRSVADIFSYLSAWFARSPFARIDGDGSAEPSVADIFGFLTRWFAGCS